MVGLSRWPPRRVLQLVAFLGASLLIFVALYVGVPYGLYHIGIGGAYRVGTFRSGSGAYSMPFDVIPDPLREQSGRTWRKSMGWAFVWKGEAVHIDAEASPRLGAITLIFDELVGGDLDPVWRHRFDSTAAIRDSVTVPGTGFYQLRFSYRDFVGDARVRWRVEGVQ